MNLSQEFKNYLFSQEVKPSGVTVKNYLSDINHFTRWFEKSFQKPFSSSEVTKQVIENYKIESLESFSASSLERHLSSLRKLFIFLKLEGKIPYSPFEQIKSEATSEADPWHIKDFKSYLYVFNASHLTIKNYLIDIKQFLNWAEEVTRLDSVDSPRGEAGPRRAGSNVLNKIDSKLIEEYKQRLLAKAQFSPATINRKLSSLRKYTSWLEAEGLVSGISYDVSSIEKAKQSPVFIPAAEEIPNTKYQILNTKYSSFPPYRLLQKVTKGINLAIDATLITQLVKIIEKAEYALWKIKGHPVFTEVRKLKLEARNLTSNFQLLNLTSSFQRPISKVKNLPKELYAPLDISTKYFPWYKKTWFTLRYKRPNWYKTYHSYAIVHYFHFAVLVIFASSLAFGFYQGFVADQGKSPALAVLPTAPPRILSFQGRLTDNNDNPITANTNLRFAIYNNLTASGSALLWQEIDNIVPDVDGIFNVLLGNNTGIPSTLFSQNNALFLGVTVENTPELTPRQQLATVAFASNSETLQGLLPITAGGAGTTNVVLALDSSGNLTIGGSATPTFQASGGQLTLSGQALLLTTNAGSNGNIQLAPDGFGLIDLTKPLVNTSLSNNIPSAAGAVEVDDLFAILASSSGQSALTINQTGAGPLISASASGVAKFTVDNSGNITAAGNGAISGTLTLSSSSPLAFTGTTPITITQTNGSTINWTDGTNNLLQIIDNGANGILNVTGSYQINGTSGASVSNACVNATGGIITSAGSCPSGAPSTDLYWNQQNGTLFPNNSTVDLLIGGQATTSAKFAILNVNETRGTQTATLSGSLTLDSSTASIQTTNNQLLTVGGNTTGNITLSPGNSLAGFNVVPGATNTVDLGTATLQWRNVYAQNFISPSTGIAGYWQRNLGTLSPTNITDSINLGSTATSSALVHLAGTAGENSFIDTGNVGIGTKTPHAILQVRGGNTGGNAAFIVNQTGNSANDIIAASASGITKFRVLNSGSVHAASLVDIDNTAYFLDPAAIGTSLTTAGNVGIGTTTPLGLLHVSSVASTSAFLSATNASNGNVSLGFSENANAGNPGVGIRLFYDATANELRFQEMSGADIMTVERITLNVGIGTTAPQAKLEIQSTGTILRLGDAGSATTNFDFSRNQTTGALTIQGNQTGNNNIVLAPTSGNVGIGKTSPLSKLDVFGDLRVSNISGIGGDFDNYYVKIQAFYSANSLKILGNSGNEYFGVYDFNKTALGLVGNVGIGTTGPLSKLSVGGVGNTSAVIFSSNTATSGYGVYSINTGSFGIGVYGNDSSGNFGIGVFGVNNGNGTGTNGTNSGTGYAIFCNATAANKCGGNQAWFNSSDRRLKENIVPINNALAKVLSLQGVTFSLKSDPAKTPQMGFIAQDVLPYVPEAVAYDESNGYYGMQTSQLTALLVNAMQEQQLQITNLASASGAIITTTGDLSFTDQTVIADANFTVPHYYSLNDILGNPITRVGAFAELAVANLRAGYVHAQALTVAGFISAEQISTNALSVATENVSIGGQSLRNYIAGVVSEILNTTYNIQNTGIISPIASIDQINTGFISPLAQNSSIALKLENDKLSIVNGNSASASAVAVFDNQGNASFSGSISANQLSIRENLDAGEARLDSVTARQASISGTLRARKIIADQIEGLNIQASTASANYITNNYYTNSTSSSNFGLISGAITSESSISNFQSIFNQFSNLNSGNFVNIATFSSQLAYVENLNAQTATFGQGLMVFGSSSLSDTSITGHLSINGNMILSDNSINVLGSDLSLQPLKQGGLSIMAGLIYIDTNGNVTFEKDATVKGTLYANVISSIPGQDLTLKLASGSSQIQNTKYKIQDTNGLDVLSVNQLGDLIASGAGTFAKLNLGLVAPALAVSPTEVIATGSAGTGVINAGRTQMTINNKLVTDKSLIYITPTSNTNNQILFLLRQVPNESFTVGIQNPNLIPIQFNWIIVN